MAIIISQIKTTLDEPKDNAVAKALSLLRLSRAETASAKLYKSSVDARRDICLPIRRRMRRKSQESPS